MITVLLVDDDPAVEATAAWLRLNGWSAEVARDGDAAIERLSAKFYDAVVLDRRMPGLGGDDVLKNIHEDPKLRHVCVVMLTGHGDIPNAVESVKMGAWQYLSKPVSPSDQKRVLTAGIAVKRCDRIRAELLSTFDRQEMIRRVREVVLDVLEADGLHIVFVGKDGKPVDAVGGETPRESIERVFWREIMAGKPFLSTDTEVETKALEPLLPDAKSLMAAPVRGDKADVIGVLHVESTKEHFFSLGWRDTVEYLADLISLALALERKEQDKLARELAKEQVKQLDDLHRELRHSIATHAQNISLQVEELASARLDDDSARRLAIIRRNSDSIQGVIARLREAAREITVQRANADLLAVVQRAIDDYRDECRGKAITIRPAPGAVPVEASVDAELLTHTLQCLLRNSIEAIEAARDESGRPEIGNICVDVRERPNQAEIILSDNGIGFEEEIKSKLFEPLFSTKTSPDKREPKGGVHDGVGLFTAWRIVSAHGGSIHANSDGIYSGARFSIRLPKVL